MGYMCWHCREMCRVWVVAAVVVVAVWWSAGQTEARYLPTRADDSGMNQMKDLIKQVSQAISQAVSSRWGRVSVLLYHKFSCLQPKATYVANRRGDQIEFLLIKFNTSRCTMFFRKIYNKVLLVIGACHYHFPISFRGKNKAEIQLDRTLIDKHLLVQAANVSSPSPWFLFSQPEQISNDFVLLVIVIEKSVVRKCTLQSQYQ